MPPSAAKKFNLDLDDKPILPESNPVVDEVIAQPLIGCEELVEKKLDFEAICLPIPSYDNDGNNIIITKAIEETSAVDLISWLRSALPVSQEYAEKLIGIKDGKEFNNTLRNKTYIFNTVVSLHENRWLFGLGKPSIEKNN